MIVSPSSKTEWIIRRSPDSITADASARSTSSRSSVSVENGPSLKPLPGVMALPSMISSAGIGPRIVVTSDNGPAESSATFTSCWRPTVRGATPIATKETTSITPIVVSTVGSRSPWKASRAHVVTSTMALISHSSRSSSAVLR